MLIKTQERIKMKLTDADRKKFRYSLRISFRKGVGSVVAVPPGYYRMQRIPVSNDAQALYSDWKRVGGYISQAAGNVKK